MKNMYLTAALGLLVLAGCSNNSDYEGPDTPGSKAEIWATISESPTRANGISWTAGDCIGVSVTNGGTGDINIQYQHSGDENLPFVAKGDREDIYIKGNAEVSLTAYYPYTGISGSESGTVMVDTRSENQTIANQKNIDWMFAEATTNRKNPQVKFQFFHQLSQLYFSFKNNDGSAPAQVTYTLKGLVIKGTFSTSTGIATPGTATDELSMTVGTSNTSCLVLLPQTTSEIVMEVVADGVFYTKTINSLTLISRKRHLYDITLGEAGQKPSITITESGVTDWQPGTGGDINSTEDYPETSTSVGTSGWNNAGEDQNVESEFDK